MDEGPYALIWRSRQWGLMVQLYATEEAAAEARRHGQALLRKTEFRIERLVDPAEAEGI